MTRLFRPLLYTAAAAGSAVMFVLAGRWSPHPINLADVSGWLAASEPVDALAELARLAGLLLAIYVALVSVAVLLAETTDLLRMPRLTRWLRRSVHAVAMPALRRRLLEVAAVASATATSLHAVPAGATSSPLPAPAASALPAPSLLPAVRLSGEFEGFNLPSEFEPAPPLLGEAHVVQPGETLWGILGQEYGHSDRTILDAVLAANPHLGDPNLILAGWTIALPATDAPPAAPSITSESSWTVVTVKRGDTLWDIVDRYYGGATAELVWNTVAANPGLADPDTIFAGQQITLPPLLDEQPPSVPPSETPPPPAPPVEASVPSPIPVGETDSPPSAPSDPPPPSDSPATTSASATSLSTLDPSEVTQPVRVERDAVTDNDQGAIPALATIVGWTGGAGLAAGLLALGARRRRRQPTAVRHARPSQPSIDVNVALRETANVVGVDRAALALRLLGTKLASRRGEPTPVPRLLRVADDIIEIVWDIPNPELIAPWRSPDAGWSWILGAEEVLAPTDAPSPCPTLVTVGRRDGADVLLNLESCGSLSIIGDERSALGIARSIATELATSVFAESPTVLVVGELALVGAPEHARSVDISEAVGWLRDRSESAGALLSGRRLTSLFALRAKSRSFDAHEPVIVIVDTSEVDDEKVTELMHLAHGDLGAVLLILGEHISAEWQLKAAPATTTLDPLGLVLEPVSIDEAFLAAAQAVIPPPDPELDESIDDAWDDGSDVDSQLVLADHLDAIHLRDPPHHCPAPPALNDDQSDVSWDVELKVLGQVRAIGTKEPLSPTELHLAIYLAFNRHGENADTIATMLWPQGISPRTLTNAMASLRRKLGTGADGEPLFPLGRDRQYTYRLSDRVVTDWDRFVKLVDRAQDLDDPPSVALLDRALSLVDGPPFRATGGYSWAYGDGTATMISETVQAVARRASESHESTGAHEAAAAARHRAQRIAGDCADDIEDEVSPATSRSQ